MKHGEVRITTYKDDETDYNGYIIKEWNKGIKIEAPKDTIDLISAEIIDLLRKRYYAPIKKQ